ncbi:integral membrane family protein [Diplodia corticola]|uniref:Integral membrane family protein n=1 Tax=Diplodia corticola TaxID=236234 RepID=A0A1J9R0T5_9PEZI|nr:integral membrane family protein [Diplodia corticola]OJD34217.1 integral membrane family protein [Diplodia corticola]
MAAPEKQGPLPLDEDARPSILGVTIGMTLLGSVFSLALRLYVRIRMSRNIGWDDCMMCMAALFSLMGMALVILEVQNGGGRHRQYIEPSVFSKGMYLNFLSQPFYLFAALFVKESVGFFLLRITGRGKYRSLIAWIMILLAIYTVACFITLLLQCKDLRVIWDPAVKTTCWRVEILHGLSYLNSVVNITTDFAFAVLIPIPLIYPLQMSVRKKLSLVVVLGVGLVAAAAAVVRAVHLPAYGRRGDFLWDSRHLTVWYVVETQIGVVAGNLPCAKPLLASSSSSSSSSSRCWWVWDSGGGRNGRGGGGGGGDSGGSGGSSGVGWFASKSSEGEGSSGSRSGGGSGGRRLTAGSEEIGLVRFAAAGRGAGAGAGGKDGGTTVAVVTSDGGAGGKASFESSRIAAAARKVSGDSITIERIDREIGGRGSSVSGPAALAGGIMRTTNVGVDHDFHHSVV